LGKERPLFYQGLSFERYTAKDLDSALLKGWTVILVSALFVLSAKDKNALFIYLAYFQND